ncbi:MULTISPECIES: S1 family peptidase [Streptomyces]|jgi:hypothetical protein|uniref:S1 family peptidase n=1 Tax=Streptomyces TaxID=1883 RepID=UPI00190899D2|nr:MULTISPECIES: S1 family peptidase [unclassified Streptomyces]MCU4746006.1 S1 family peptidase [Streptomyces sp. G-5]QQN76339.1 alpha-lytic protease prodomain-containing protein [Streptomyces sp. XC 2026]
MRRTRSFTLGAAALMVLTAGVGGAAVAADSSTPAPGGEPVAEPALIEALQRDLGLTPEQAVDRLATEAEAMATDEEAQEAAGDAYAGSWIDAATGTLVVAVTSAAAESAVESTGAATERVTHSQDALDAALAALDELEAPAGVSSWYADVQDNGIGVDVVAGSENTDQVADFLAEAEAVQSIPLTVRTVEEAYTTSAAGVVGGDPYYTGNVRCSVGFSVHGGFITAGHCGSGSAAVYGWDNSLMGNFAGRSWPGGDHAWVRTGHGWWTVPVVLGWGTVSDALVRGSNEAPTGASVCRSGSTTGWRCGTIGAKNVTVNYGNGNVVYGMTNSTACAEGGDSGGSFISGDQAQGVTSGAAGNCSSGGSSVFYPIRPILSAYGLTLHTA